MDGKQISKGKATSTGTKATGKGPQKRYPLRTIISSLMFSNGDSDQPFDMCQNFVLDVVRSQLRMLIGKANKLALERGRKTIGYLEMAFAFRRHPTLIKRLVLYIQMTLSATTLIRSIEPVEELSPSEDADDVAVVEEEFMEEVEEEEEGEQQNDSNTALLPSTSTDQSKKKQKTKSVKLKRSNRLITAIREFDVLGHLLAGFDPATGTFPNWLDPGKLERMHRQVQRTGQMSAEMYARFAVARQMSFCSHRGVKSARLCKQFMKWLRKGSKGMMAMDQGVVFVLNFCASEIVTILVESALLVCSEQEREMPPVSDQPDATESPLQLCHYQEALRRNQGWAKRGDILFGYF